MLEFAYTGEVNVAQELLPSLLHTAKSFRIKGLDKVENPVDPGPITRVNQTYYLTTLCPDPYKLILQNKKIRILRYFHQIRTSLEHPVLINKTQFYWRKSHATFVSFRDPKLRPRARNTGWNPRPPPDPTALAVSTVSKTSSLLIFPPNTLCRCPATTISPPYPPPPPSSPTEPPPLPTSTPLVTWLPTPIMDSMDCSGVPNARGNEKCKTTNWPGMFD